MIEPNITYINGQPWSVRLLTGGQREGSANEWDTAIEKLGSDNDLLHWKDMFSWCQESAEGYPAARVGRGFSSAQFWGYDRASYQAECIGFRPVLVPIDPCTLAPDLSRLSGMEDGTIMRMGALFMDESPVVFPSNPTFSGDITPYQPGATIRIRGTPADISAKYLLQFIKCEDILICDRNILKNISWDTLEKQGLIYGREAKRPTLAKQIDHAAEKKHSSTLFGAKGKESLTLEQDHFR